MSWWKTSDEFPGSISLPYGIKTSHTWHEIGQILRILNDLDVEVFIELGTHVGGLASILLPLRTYKDFQYFGVEHKPEIVHPAVKDAIYFVDVFSSSMVLTIKTLGFEKRKFVYCDNGDKIREMDVYRDTLKSGDIIACHDYYDGQWVDGLVNFGVDNSCGCVPEVWRKDLAQFESPEFRQLDDYFLNGTRIMGFIKQ